MSFHPNAIDFVKTYQNFKKKYGGKRVCRKSFCIQIVRMADSVLVYDRMSSGFLKGVKKCLEHEIGRIEWRGEIAWIIPDFSRKRLFHDLRSETDQKALSLLSDSLILTIIMYRNQLSGSHHGRADVVFSEIVLGSELVCYWIEEGIKINTNQNNLIEVIDIDRLTKKVGPI